MARLDRREAVRLFRIRLVSFSLSLAFIVGFFIFTYFTLNTGYADRHLHIFITGFTVLIVAALGTGVETIILTRTAISLFTGKNINELKPDEASQAIARLRILIKK
ncbi:MAG: hypothetical protein RE471_09020 [Ferroplasma sp.]|uniref:hypothetical protein n=1 Tax=Ferroplasma sp. TaxID=2591003 RepID=UPI002814A90B|nr:hypothetical protein [Ferroplasma sp.]WMT51105.1 MAG: hypothetical protein RE471_09020 [Ferroplasma sp.]